MRKIKKANLIEGSSELIGTDNRDVFVLREGQGDITVSGFDVTEDKILFDFNSYSDVLGFGQDISDGSVITDFTGQTRILVEAIDANSDGITDTRFTVGEDSIILLGVAPDSLASGNLMGG